MTILGSILFLVFVLSLLCGAHYAIYRYLIAFFGIERVRIRRVLLISTVPLALSFPVGAVSSHLWPNLATVALYGVGATWIGLAINLLMAVTLSWAAVGGFRLARREPPRRWIAGVMCTAALGYAALGVWNAYHPHVRHLEISLEGLPDSWKGKRIVHLSDVHLGHLLGLGFWDRVIRLTNEQHPEAVLITGDLFDGMGGDFPAFLPGLDRFETRHGVYFVSGNHEVYNREFDEQALVGRAAVQVIDHRVVDLDGLLFVGVGYPGLEGPTGQAFLDRYTELLGGDQPSILLFHTPTEIDLGEDDGEAHQPGVYFAPDVSNRCAVRLGIDLQLSGHTHAGQITPFGMLTRLIYRGREYGLHEEDGFQIYVSCGTGTWGPPMRTGRRSEVVVITLQ